LVLTFSYADAALIGRALPEIFASKAYVRREGEPLEMVRDWLKRSDDAVVICAGAWEGLDLPGLIDNLIVSRLPIAPPVVNDVDERGNNQLFAWAAGEDRYFVSFATARMLRRLRQGLGRATRAADDDVSIYVCDPRFGLPAEVMAREFSAGNFDPQAGKRPHRLRTMLGWAHPAEREFMPESIVEAVDNVRSHIASTVVAPRSRPTELLGPINEFALVLRRAPARTICRWPRPIGRCWLRPASSSMAMRGVSARRERHRDKVFDRDQLACQIRRLEVGHGCISRQQRLSNTQLFTSLQE
jgi:RAD3-like DEAD/DEAH box helicase